MKNKIAILYGPKGGNTEKAAKLIAKKIGPDKCDLILVKEADEDSIASYNSLIIGGSTIGTHNWSMPNSSTDWDEFLPKFKKTDFKNKKVAIFGLGDHLGYPNTFVDGMRTIYDILIENNATVLGQCATDDYEFNESQAIVDDKFVGLPIDEDYEEELTENRIEQWIKAFIDKM
jgi:flavodoxin I